MLDVALAAPARIEQTLHLYHPHPTLWTTMMRSAASALASHNPLDLPLVPWSEWSNKLESLDFSEESMMRVPALKLRSFFRSIAAGDDALRVRQAKAEDRNSEALGLVKLETVKMESASKTLRELNPLDVEDPARWIRYWYSKGLF